MKIGDLVKFTDQDTDAGFAKPEEYIGLVVGIDKGYTCPNSVEVLLPDGSTICEWEDELIVYNPKS
tara:strand:+ start:725 stop:922 length:198 start_codon:yes stop_codon:yes gene_type:complete